MLRLGEYVIQVLEHLRSKCEELSLNYSISIKKKKAYSYLGTLLKSERNLY
jgi:hypothetical protein